MSVYPSRVPLADVADRLKSVVGRVMQISDTTLGGNGAAYDVRFRGRLVVDSAEAYTEVAEGFQPHGFTPLFRRDGDSDVVYAAAGVLNPPPSKVWVNVLMFGLTVLSVLFTGATLQADALPTSSNVVAYILSGWPFAVSILGILGTHELGHYFAARHHKVAVTLPYFIPFPLSYFGTMGAFIRLKAPPTNKRVLLDIGLAGPLAGLVVAIPVLVIGLLLSEVDTLPTVIAPQTQFMLEGNSILYLATKFLVFGELLPAPASYGGVPPLLFWVRYFFLGTPAPLGGHDVLLHPVAWAGWAGLLVTGLNLIPAGQLDGGHIMYVLLGKRAGRLLPLIIGALLLMGLLWSGWFFWAFLIYFLGRAHAEPLDQITELDPTRRALAILGMVIFALVFTPIPLRIFGA